MKILVSLQRWRVENAFPRRRVGTRKGRWAKKTLAHPTPYTLNERFILQ